jgi:hypothetical protein
MKERSGLKRTGSKIVFGLISAVILTWTAYLTTSFLSMVLPASFWIVPYLGLVVFDGGIQEAGRYWDNSELKFVDKERMTCETCNGEGYLGPKLEMVILKLQIDCGDPEYFEYNGPNAEDAARWRVEKAKQDNTKQGKRDVRAWIVTVEPTSGGWHVIA